MPYFSMKYEYVAMVGSGKVLKDIQYHAEKDLTKVIEIPSPIPRRGRQQDQMYGQGGFVVSRITRLPI